MDVKINNNKFHLGLFFISRIQCNTKQLPVTRAYLVVNFLELFIKQSFFIRNRLETWRMMVSNWPQAHAENVLPNQKMDLNMKLKEEQWGESFFPLCVLIEGINCVIAVCGKFLSGIFEQHFDQHRKQKNTNHILTIHNTHYKYTKYTKAFVLQCIVLPFIEPSGLMVDRHQHLSISLLHYAC